MWGNVGVKRGTSVCCLAARQATCGPYRFPLDGPFFLRYKWCIDENITTLIELEAGCLWWILLAWLLCWWKWCLLWCNRSGICSKNVCLIRGVGLLIKMNPPRIEVGVVKIILWRIRNWIAHRPMPRFLLTQMPTAKRPAFRQPCAQTSYALSRTSAPRLPTQSAFTAADCLNSTIKDCSNTL